MSITGDSSDNILIGTLEDDFFDGLEGDDIFMAAAGNDRGSGGVGNDTFFGGSGNDWSIGGDGDDHTIGGFGDDVFDGEAGNDAFGADLVLGILSESQFFLGSSANSARDRFIYDTNDGALCFDPDGTGDTAQVQIAILSNNTDLNSSDILIV